MWKKVVTVIAIILLLGGIGFLLFPTVSNQIGQQRANNVIEEYSETLDNIIKEDEPEVAEKLGITAKTHEEALELGEIDECDFDAPFEWEDWNRERYACEQELTLVNLIEYCVFVPDRYVKQMTMEERKKIAEERYVQFEDKTNVFAVGYEQFLQKIDDYSSYVEKTVEKTIF